MTEQLFNVTNPGHDSHDTSSESFASLQIMCIKYKLARILLDK